MQFFKRHVGIGSSEHDDAGEAIITFLTDSSLTTSNLDKVELRTFKFSLVESVQ